MRPQQNRRIRGRNNNNNNRRGPNPLSRNYESNGPEVKIRGNAQHIADKYTALARDAQASGDRVMAENYLQHAEHYVRIILAAQAQMPQPVQRDEFIDEDDENSAVEMSETNDEQDVNGNGPQPEIDGVPAEIALVDNGITSEEPREPRRARRVPRRRMASNTNTDAAESDNSETDEANNSTEEEIAENHQTDDEQLAEATEKKPRRRRTAKPKAEKAAEEEA